MTTDGEWGPPRRAAFRFAFVFFMLQCAGLLELVSFGRYPPLSWLVGLYWRVCKAVVPFLNEHVLAFTPEGTPNGSDSEFAWMKLVWTAAIAAIAAAVWTLAARRKEYRRLDDVLRTVVRHTLAATMLDYGLSKVFALQFWAPTPTDLVQTFGGSSPFGLVWRFVGFSTPYMVFSGIMECVGAGLILWRRTTTLGALVLAAVLTNVVLMNFCYAIPVKNYSLAFLCFALFLLVPEIPRLLDFLVLHRPTAPRVLRPYPLSRGLERARLAVKAAWVVGLVGLLCLQMVQTRARRADQVQHLLWGLYDVEEMRRDGVAVPLVITDTRIWQQVAFGRNWGPTAVIVTGDGERHGFDTELDEAKGTLTLHDDDDRKSALRVARPDATHLVLDGDFYGQKLNVRLRARDLTQATLLATGFRWVDDGGFWR